MANYGIMLYGYNKKNSEEIRSFVSELMKEDVDLFGASPESNYMVKDIVLDPEKSEFLDSPNKFFMFLGMDNSIIQQVLNDFPSNIQRPIFCTMTENNIKWHVNYLIEHLLEEEAKMNGEK